MKGTKSMKKWNLQLSRKYSISIKMSNNGYIMSETRKKDKTGKTFVVPT
jgi:hypothetical protein